MKLPRVCLLLLALCPLASVAAAAGPDGNPLVEEVQCSGNIATSCALIRSQAAIAVGGKLDEAQVEAARLRLEGLTRFRSVRIHLSKGSQKHRVIVVIEVVESSPFTSAFAFGSLWQFPRYSGDVTGVVAGRVTNYDLFGSGKGLDFAMVAARPINGNGSAEYAGRLEYRDPRLAGAHTFFFSAGVFYSQSTFSLVNYSRDYAIANAATLNPSSGRGYGVDFSVGMHLGTYSYVTAGFRYVPNLGRDDDNFLVKPFSAEKIVVTVRRCLEMAAIKERLRIAAAQTEPTDIVGESRAIKLVVAETLKVARTQANVLIVGESGTGKELIAGTIHAQSERREGPLVKVNWCCRVLTRTCGKRWPRAGFARTCTIG